MKVSIRIDSDYIGWLFASAIACLTNEETNRPDAIEAVKDAIVSIEDASIRIRVYDTCVPYFKKWEDMCKETI